MDSLCLHVDSIWYFGKKVRYGDLYIHAGGLVELASLPPVCSCCPYSIVSATEKRSHHTRVLH